MRIGLFGYGRMGKEVERCAVARGFEVTLRHDVGSPEIDEDLAATFDVAVHFAAPDAVLPHITMLAAFGKNVVIGTTGWGNQLEAVRAVTAARNIGIVAASNFSLGVNIFAHLVRSAGEMFDKFPEYDPFIQEVHHHEKKDSPSGTALYLADQLLATIHRKRRILTGPSAGMIEPDHIHIASIRAGSVVGTHSVTFDSPADSIELKHTARNRDGFALGAVVAASWVHGKRGWFSMEDVLKDLL